MQRYYRTVCITILMFVVGSTSVPAAEQTTEIQKAAILNTIAEAAVATVSLVQDRSPAKLEGIAWSASYSERDWIFTLDGKLANGEALHFAVSGYLWGADNEDWLISYAGLGQQGKDPIRINGRTLWRYDSKVSDHLAADFQQNIKFGEHSVWGWVLGSEIIFGGIVGAGGAIVTAGLSTGGIALGAAAWIGASGAALGAGGLACASEAAKNLLEANSPPPPPPAPERPPVPKNGEKLFPQKGMIYTVVSHDGTLLGSGPDGVLLISGKFGATSASGTMEERRQ